MSWHPAWVIILVALSLAGVIWGSLAFVERLNEKHQEEVCKTTAEGIGLKHDFSDHGGCRVRLGTKLVPIDQLRYVVDGKAVKVEVEED